MKWIEVSVRTTHEASEAIAEKFMNMGANGTEMVDPTAFRQVLENNRYLDYADDGTIEKYGTDVIVKAYFSDELSPIAITDEIKLFLDSISNYINIGPGEVNIPCETIPNGKMRGNNILSLLSLPKQ